MNKPVQDTCDLNAKNHLKELTPLHHASQRGFSRTVEYLVGYGADINATDSDGNSALHTVTVLKDMAAPSVHSPQLQEVRIQCIQCVLDRTGAKSSPFFKIEE